MSPREIDRLAGFTDLEFDLLTLAGVRDQLSAGPVSSVYAAVWHYGIRVARPSQLAKAKPDVVFEGDSPATNPARVRTALCDRLLVLHGADSLEAAAERTLSGLSGLSGPRAGERVRWHEVPAELQDRARASWIHRTGRHLDYAAGRIARLGQRWHRQLMEPVRAAMLEGIAEDLVEVGRWKAPSERAAREATEVLLAREPFLRDRIWILTRRPLGHPACDSERELVLEVIRWSARARMAA